MVPALLDMLLERPFTFVAGKGGTGKSTTAAAFALARADTGQPTHLLSTDPAHSVADIFDSRIPSGTPVTAPCAADLQLEELNAEHTADAWLMRARVPLEQLIASGTYLSAADAARFTHLTLPGVDEIAAALRLVELSGSGSGVIVDTAPTGHTLRLLGAPGLIDSWVSAFRAMADKAAAVSDRMVGAHVRGSGEEIVDELEQTAAGLRRVFQDAAFVVTTRNGAVVEAETARLLEELDRRSLHVTAVITMGPDSKLRPAGISIHCTIPRLADVRGCAGLRRWWAALAQHNELAQGDDHAPVVATGSRPADVRSASISAQDTGAARVLRSDVGRLAWFAGKGGTGKSTCAAAAAVSLAAERRVLLCSTDPAGSLGDVFGHNPLPAGGEILPNLRVLQVDAAAELEVWRSRHGGEIEKALDVVGLGGSPSFDQDVIRKALDVVPPGIDELLAISTILDAAEGDETILIDASPTGHFLRLIATPAIALEWTHAVLRIILDYGAAGKLDGFSERMLAFARQLKHLSALLTDPARCGVFVVTLREPVVEAETNRLVDALHSARVRVAARILNRTGPDACPPSHETVLCAPDLDTAPTGAAALAHFLARWQVAA
ncbi:MAG TPA: ArsA family ATPase [Longimicrobiales bacterium]